MGCICSKGIEGDSSGLGRRRNTLKRLANSSGLEDTLVKDVGARLSIDSNDGGRERLISEPEENGVNPARLLPDNGTLTAATSFTQTKKAARQEKWGSRNGRAAQAELDAVGSEAGDKQLQRSHKLIISSMTNGVIEEHVAAGWPAWLTRVAGEAVKGWLPRKLDSFSSMEKIGQGTYSTVYKALDLVTGKTVALKKVRFVNMDAESVRFMAREIYILRRLDHPNVIKLEGLVASKMSSSLWLIFQYMEHDLAGLVARPGINFTQSQIKCFMQQLFNGLNHCHNNGILHRDIKGANLLINNDGILKIADFGLATFFSHEMKHPLTSRVVTLWYRPPELLLGAQEYGVSVDLWSSGCILAELFARKPIMPGRTEVEQLHMIFKLCGSPSEEYWRKSKLPHATIFKPQHPYKSTVSDEFREFPSPAVALLEKLLAVDPADRGTSSSALMSEFFTMEPVACDPSELPKCPPSKELGFKRNVDAVRQREAPKKENGHESGRKGSKDYKGLPVFASNAEQQLLPANPKSSSARHNPLGDTGMGFLNERLRGTTENGFAHAGGYGPANKNSKVGNSSSGFGRLDSHISWRRRSRCLSIGNDAKYSGFSGPMASTRFADPDHIEEHDQTDLPKQQRGSAHNQHEANTSATLQFKHSSNKGDDRGKESAAAYVPKRNRIIYSGPIMPTMENIDEMLKEHERKIEQAVREAYVKKTKNKMYAKGQSEALLFTGRK